MASLSAMAFALVLGCSKSEAAQRPSAEVAEAAETPLAATDTATGSNYVATIKPVGTYEAGKEAAVEVTLTPTGGYHINAEYPYKFKLAEPADGVSYPKPILKREDGAIGEKLATFKVPFVASKAGKATITGTLYLSVCSEANCVMDRQPLALTVDVK